jgi:predicted branched-subunit amino acid permease
MFASSLKAQVEVQEAVIDIWPVMVAALPIGLLFGALCVGKGTCQSSKPA